MLRDLIAALVTERAERLAALSDPSDAFLEEPYRWETTPYRRVVHRLRPELTGFELVLASSNNGAVENVTLEIPSSEAIDAPWRERAERIDYFPGLAERAMGADRSTSGAWALIAARLGNSKNRKAFVNAVWWTERREKGDKRPPPPPASVTSSADGRTAPSAPPGPRRWRRLSRRAIARGGDPRRSLSHARRLLTALPRSNRSSRPPVRRSGQRANGPRRRVRGARS